MTLNCSRATRVLAVGSLAGKEEQEEEEEEDVDFIVVLLKWCMRCMECCWNGKRPFRKLWSQWDEDVVLLVEKDNGRRCGSLCL